MTRVLELLRRNSIEFTWAYLGKETDPTGAERHRFEAGLRAPGMRDDAPTLPRAMSYTYFCDQSEYEAIHHGSTGAVTRYVGVQQAQFAVVHTMLHQAERVLACGGWYADDAKNFREWLQLRGVVDPKFPLDETEAYDPGNLLPEVARMWRNRWAQEKRTAQDLLMLIGRTEYEAWHKEIER